MTLTPAERDELGTAELQDRRLDRLRSLAELLDNAVTLPGGYRVGLDPIIGLVPGLGDLVGAGFSGLIILESARLGAPRAVLARMAANVGLEALLGAVPFLGDLFDFVWKANTRNLALLERHLNRPAQTRRASRWFVGLLLAGLVLVVAGAVVGVVWLIGGLAGMLPLF